MKYENTSCHTASTKILEQLKMYITTQKDLTGSEIEKMCRVKKALETPQL